ncbi:MAG TPA: protein translocase subunit SecD [Opitutaceae bacterium]|jgi:SecD/SecF fusion protein|nr:protein translocase subunit SecD [Opitutaceae bacterium]
MFKRNLWKLILSALILTFAVAELVPLQDRPFADYAHTHATAKPTEFAKLLDEAAARQKAGQAPSVFVALKQIARERKIDLTQFYPDINIESTLMNVDKRNDILLTELLKRSKSKFQLGLDLRGGVAVTLEVDSKAAGNDPANIRQDKLTKAIEIISARINAFGVVEPVIRPVGNNRIEIELPGVNTKDNPEILDNIKKPAQLTFCLVHPTLTPRDVAPGDVPPGYQEMSYTQQQSNGTEFEETLFVKRIPEMTGKDISNSYARPDMYGKPEVDMQFTTDGRKRFADVTGAIAAEGQRTGHLGRMAIVLDGKLYSAPTVREEIDSNAAVITGNFTDREAMDLANVLNNPLDLPLIVKEQYEVGPSLADDAISSGVRASIIGVTLVAAFMVTFYTTGGLVAVLMLAVNLVIILGVMASFGATMTLPGLAGIVLTVGMAVDANILIFERMREELALGKSLASANQSGYLKALWTILDAHAVQLIICCIMISLGTGPIKGFGVTLAIGVLSTLFSVLITSHLVMEYIIESGLVKKIRMNRILKDIQVDFIRYGKAAFFGGWLLVLIGVGYVVYQGPKIYGIDFAGGDMINVQFKHQPDVAKIRAVAKASGVSDINITSVNSIGGGGQALNIETPEGKADAVFGALQTAFPQAGLEKIGESHIGASIGKEIELNALLAIGVSMATILVYIAFRFEFGFGVGAMVSTLHDILMTIGIFVLTGHQFTAPMVAAILCIAGYSINETVVVFDRIREELKLNPNGSLRDVINTAIRKVFARTIMTASTTFLAALALFLFGGGVLHDISFTFLVGIVTSTFSAIFVASQVFYYWHKGDRKHVEAHSDIAPKYEWQGASRASR